MVTHIYQKTKDKEAMGNSYTSIIYLNINKQNLPLKLHGVTDLIKEHNPNIC